MTTMHTLTYDGTSHFVHLCKFTGKERDTESGLDYFGARYYASNMGRWMSPDWADKPEAVPYSSLGNPQSLNLYGYVGNNPLRAVDPDGHLSEEGRVAHSSRSTNSGCPIHRVFVVRGEWVFAKRTAFLPSRH